MKLVTIWRGLAPRDTKLLTSASAERLLEITEQLLRGKSFLIGCGPEGTVGQLLSLDLWGGEH